MDNPIQELQSPSQDMIAAFQNAQSAPLPEAQQPALPADEPVVPAPAPEAQAAAVVAETAPAPAVEPAPAPAAPDYNAWVKETYGVEPDAVKSALDNQSKVAEWQKAAEQAATVRELLADPAKLREFADLTTQDFAALAKDNPKDVLLAQFKASKPGMPADVAQTLFEREFNAKYPGLNYDDPDDALFQSDSRLLAYEAGEAAKFMQDKQAEARKVLDAPTQAAPEGPSAAEVEAQAAAYVQSVEEYVKGSQGADFTVEGQTVSVDIAQADSYKNFMLDPVGAFKSLILDDKGNIDMEKLDAFAFWQTQRENILSTVAKAAKGSAGPVVPIGQLVNNTTAATPPPAQGDRAGLIEALAAASRGQRGSTY